MLSREEAIKLVKNCSKYSHSLLSSKMMKRLAEKLGEDGSEWELVGLLHDLDIDEVRSDMSRHGVVTASKLKDTLPEHCLYAIKAHDHRTGFKPKSQLDKALIAVDSLVKLTEKVQAESQEPNIDVLKVTLMKLSVTKPWHFRNVQLCREFGLSLDEFLVLVFPERGGV